VRRDGVLVDKVDAGYFDGWYCQGVAIDLRARVFRAFPCPLRGHHKGSLDLRLRTAPVWSGWDAGFAWGGREELAEVVPGARRVIAPYELEVRPLAELPLGDRDQWFSAWNADRFELVVHDDVASADWYDSYDGRDLVSVITTDLRVLDYRLLPDTTGSWTDTVLPWLVHGPPLVDTLRGQAPYPFPSDEEFTGAGLIIDLDQRVLRYWTNDYIPVRLLADIRAAWPGWDLQRLRYGFAEHLAVTGRRDPDGLATPQEVAADWDAARRDLRPDPRPLRTPHVRVAES
jgi:hypothetical protein